MFFPKAVALYLVLAIYREKIRSVLYMYFLTTIWIQPSFFSFFFPSNLLLDFIVMEKQILKLKCKTKIFNDGIIAEGTSNVLGFLLLKFPFRQSGRLVGS